MVRPVKERGAKELSALMKRVMRAYAMGRINRTDYDYLLERLQQVEARIIIMSETDELGEEVLEPDGETT